MNKCELLEKGGSIRKRGAVLVPAIFTQGIRIPAFLTPSEPKKNFKFPVMRLHVQVTAAKRGEDNFRIADNQGIECLREVPSSYDSPSGELGHPLTIDSR